LDIFELLKTRKSVRAYLDKDVEKESILKILEASRYTPTGVNMQPFDVHVVTGKLKKEIEDRVIEKYSSGKKSNMDYQYYPKEWKEPYKSRRKETGLLMYQTLGITRDDKDRQKEQWKANYRAFDAPVVLYFFIDSSLECGSFLDYGMFLQSIMLCATELGIATVPMASVAEYPDISNQAK
jgi:nitroreductase